MTTAPQSDRESATSSPGVVSLAQLFTEARTYSAWLDKGVSDDTLRQIYELVRWAPTSANSSPGRILFVRPGAEKDKLLAALMPGNVEKTRSAPVTAVLAHDVEFYEKLPYLFPHFDMRAAFAGNPKLAAESAVYNGALQSAYFILAARAVGLDVGPMAGFDREKVDAAFFSNTTWRANLVVNIGYGDASKLFPRGPRLSFEEACRIVG